VEALRPKVSAEAAARRLDVPYLGDLGSHAATPLVPIHRRVAELAQAAGATAVVITPVGRATTAQAAAATHILAAALQAEAEKGASEEMGSRVLVMPLGNGHEEDVADEAVGEALEWRPVEVADLGATTDPRSGFVVLTTRSTPVSSLRSTQAQIQASGRPLLAVVGIHGHLAASPSTGALDGGVPGHLSVREPSRQMGNLSTPQGRPGAEAPTPNGAGAARSTGAGGANGAGGHGRSTGGSAKAGQASRPSAAAPGQSKPNGVQVGNTQESKRG
jgi:hypothetical protein